MIEFNVINVNKIEPIIRDGKIVEFVDVSDKIVDCGHCNEKIESGDEFEMSHYVTDLGELAEEIEIEFAIHSRCA